MGLEGDAKREGEGGGGKGKAFVPGDDILSDGFPLVGKFVHL